MNNMIRLKDKLINKNSIYYILEKIYSVDTVDTRFYELIFVTKTNNYVVSYNSHEEMLKEIRKLKQVGFTQIGEQYINLDKVVCIDSFSEDTDDYLLVMFEDDLERTFNLKTFGYSPEEIVDDIMLGSKYL